MACVYMCPARSDQSIMGRGTHTGVSKLSAGCSMCLVSVSIPRVRDTLTVETRKAPAYKEKYQASLQSFSRDKCRDEVRYQRHTVRDGSVKARGSRVDGMKFNESRFEFGSSHCEGFECNC